MSAVPVCDLRVAEIRRHPAHLMVGTISPKQSAQAPDVCPGAAMRAGRERAAMHAGKSDYVCGSGSRHGVSVYEAIVLCHSQSDRAVTTVNGFSR